MVNQFVHASMEPRVFSHGDDQDVPEGGQHAQRASMEPRVFSHGDISRQVTSLNDPNLASMEPRVFSHGDTTRNREDSARPSTLQWSHGYFPMVTLYMSDT